MTFWCVEHLHRLPEEVEAPFSALMRGMIAYAVMSKRLEQQAKR